jgi:hypothetical protein
MLPSVTDWPRGGWRHPSSRQDAPAVTVLTRQVVTARPSERDPDGLRVPIGMAQVFIPAPDRPYVVVLTLMTPTPDDFDDYARAMAAMACTVRFDDPALDEVQA